MDVPRLLAEGIAAAGREDHAAALHCFEALLAAEPGDIAALKGCSAALAGLGRLDAAAQRLAGVLAVAPDDVYALFNRGLLLSRLQRYAEALPCFARIVALQPDHFDALLCLGIALRCLQRHAEAEVCLRRALELDGRHADALLNLGLALGLLERHGEALDCFERILAVEPRHAKASLNRSVALGRLGRHAEALAGARTAVALAPQDAGAHAQLGFELASLNRHEEALPCLEQALALDPQQADALEHRGFVQLGLGQLQQGFHARESRWNVAPLKGTQLNTAAPLWLGRPELAGRTILLQHEQGFGDTLQFVRYAPLVAARGGRVILRVPAELAALLGGVAGVERVVTEREPIPPHDFHCPMMSLPLAFDTTLQTIPCAIPYLGADPARVAHWRARGGGKLRVGIAWAGRQHGGVNSLRDMPLAALLPLLELDAAFVSLQREVPPGDQALLDTLPQLLRWGETLRDFADTAALIATLDLVIAVDTAVVHLAGALGRPVWIMNRFASCWRWMRERADSPWYPSARLFRQRAFGDWDGVVAGVRQALAQELQRELAGR